MSLIRQGCAHSGDYSHVLYSIQNNSKYYDLTERARIHFSDDLNSFNKNYLAKNKMNLFILFNLYNCLDDRQQQEIIVKDFYKFILYKDSKNLGFNLKTIRNMVIEGRYSQIDRETMLNSFRTKINTLLDYYLYNYYFKKPELIDSIVKKLRESECDEEKENVYKEEYARIKKEDNDFIGKECVSIVRKIQEAIAVKFDAKNKTFDVKNNLEAQSFLGDDNIECSSFPSLIYTLCKFLDGKEVNELTTAIINKLENIKSLIDALIAINKWDGFNADYEIFNDDNIDKLIDEFRIVKNLSASKRKLKKANSNDDKIGKRLYSDAINLFKKDNYVSTNDPEGTGLDIYLTRFNENDSDKKVRNFLLNTIIKNRRFIYLIKCIDPKDCYKLVHNEKLLRFILGEFNAEQMPLSQLQRYYDAIVENREGFRKCVYRKLMIDTIVKEIMSISFDKIIDFGDGFSKKNNDDYINHQKQIVSLYLTIAYLVVKGVVHTNSIYFIAWSMFERDYCYKYSVDINRGKVNYFALNNDYQSNKKPRVKKLIEHNIEEANKSLSNAAYRNYRNKVMHLNICGSFAKYIDDIGDIKSYFDIYSYAVQKWIISENGVFINEEYKTKLVNDLNKYNTYQRNFLKIINLPFAYNLARYKNLTIGDLFNDEYPVPKETMKEYYNEE